MNYKYILALLLACFFMLIWGLGGYDIVDPDGPRFALVAKEMLENNQWIMPHRNEYAYPDKPPFFFWCIAFFSYWSGEVNSFTARLPSAIAAMGVIFLMFQWIKKDSADKKDFQLPILTSFVLLSSFLFFYQARMTQIDMVMCFFVTGAMIEGYQLISGERKSVWPMAIYMGLGTITKGPIAFLLPLGACATYIFFKKLEWKKLPWKSILISFLIPLAWLAFLLIEVIERNEWGYLQNLLFKQTIVRYANSWHHDKPIYYFLKTFLWDFFPWTPFFLVALFFSLKKWQAISNKEKYAWCICLFVLIFFSIPKGKRNIYILPIFPFAAYIVALTIHYYIKLAVFPQIYKWLFRSLFVIFLLFAGVLISISLEWLVLQKAKTANIQIPYNSVFNYGLSLLLISVAGLISIREKPMKYAFGILFFLMLQINLFTFHIVLPTLDPIRSVRGFMQEVISITEENESKPKLGMVEFKERFRFYGNQHIIELDNVHGESKNGDYGVERFWQLYPNGWLIINKKNWDDYVKDKAIKGIRVYEQTISDQRIYYLIRRGI